MKKIIVILSILLTLSLAGILYGTHNQPEEVEIVTAEQAYDFIPYVQDPTPDFMLF